MSVVLFDGFELLDVFGPVELFGMVPGKVDVEFVGPQAGAVASGQGAQAMQLVLVGGKALADLLDLIDGEILIVLVEVLWVAQLEVGAGVLGDEGEPLGDLVKGADRRALDHEGGSTVAARPHLLHVDANLVVVHVV